MEEDKAKIFIVLEEHLRDRYTYIIDKYNFESYLVTNFGDLLLGSSIVKTFERIHHREILENEYKKLINWIKSRLQTKNVDQIYLSNSEGYVAHNFAIRLKKEFPEIKLVALQHGVFSLSRIPKKSTRLVINKTCKVLFGFYPIGIGFGGKIVDKYIVYNDFYKKFLIDRHGWKENEVEVNFKFLKSDLYDKKIEGNKTKDTAVLLLQCLSKAKLCTDKDESFLNTTTINYLSRKYKEVLIKEHPVYVNQERFTLPSNCRYIDNLVDAFNQSTHAYSFMSTALLDAEIFDIETFAIDSELINCDKKIYELFKKTLSSENTINI